MAATGSGCALTYLAGGTLEQIEITLTNSLATASGMVCDGAKPSCAAKIATCLESAIMAYNLAMEGRAFQGGEGIVKNSVEETVAAVGCVANQGMRRDRRGDFGFDDGAELRRPAAGKLSDRHCK